MVYIEQWEEFQRAAEELYISSPNRTRYVAKYRHVDGELILKVTDGPTALKYRTDRLQDVRRFERLNRSLLRKILNRRDEAGEGTAEGPSASETPKSAKQAVASKKSGVKRKGR